MRNQSHGVTDEASIIDRVVSNINRSVGVTTYADDPVAFAYEVLGVPSLTQRQINILESIRDNSETNVQAGHGVGKTFVLAIAVIWWVFAVEGRAINTAPTEALADLLWVEIAALYDRNEVKLGGKRGKRFLYFRVKARADGFVAREYKQGGFAGHHGERLLAIQDEASGISDIIDDGFESCLTYHRNRGVRTGNPLAGGTAFAKACAKTNMKIPVWDHPNVAWAYDSDCNLKDDVREAIVGEKGEVLDRDLWPDWCQVEDPYPGAVSIEWIEKRRGEAHRGPGTAYWISRLDAEFPDDVEEALVPRSWFDAARARYDDDPKYWDDRSASHDWVQAIDVGDGGDPHALVARRGPVLYAAKQYPTHGDRKDVTRAAGIGAEALRSRGGSLKVDNIGVGAGTLAILLDNAEDGTGPVGADACDFRGEPHDKERFRNQRAECHLSLREAFKSDDFAVAPLGPDEEYLREELATIRRLPPTAKGLLGVEEKKNVKPRLGRSPNLGDAAAMTFFKAPEKKKKKKFMVSKPIGKR